MVVFLTINAMSVLLSLLLLVACVQKHRRINFDAHKKTSLITQKTPHMIEYSIIIVSTSLCKFKKIFSKRPVFYSYKVLYDGVLTFARLNFYIKFERN